jgi:pimeloyl-ACP methyl ester carboxylesterase
VLASGYGGVHFVDMKLFLKLALLAALGMAACAHAQDYAREKRYAEEVVSGLVVGDAVNIKATSGREFLGLYTPGKAGKPAIVLVHGVGVHPDFGVIGLLRAKLADLGYTTLAIQMPVQGKEAKVDDYYPTVFPDAADRMAKAADWLRAKGQTNVVLLSHSMGAWMANEYLDKAHEATPYKAWIVMGLTGSYSWGMRRYALPVLDVYGELDIAPVMGAALRRKLALKDANGSRQVKIDGADHHYTGRESAVVTAVDAFLLERK